MRKICRVRVEKLAENCYQVRLFITDNYGTYECGIINPYCTTRKEATDKARQLRSDYR